MIFRGRPPIPEELDILRDVIPDAKRAFKGSADSGLARRTSEKSSITADTPVPLPHGRSAGDDRRAHRTAGRPQRQATSAVAEGEGDRRDQRSALQFLVFSSNTITDTILETIAKIFRIPGDGRPITTFQLAGIPSEVVNSVASVLCRMAFEIALWSNGGVHMLVVCEEAHRYVPADVSLGFVPTRQAIARIAKEGRKYGVSLGSSPSARASLIRPSCRSVRRCLPCGFPTIATRKSSARRSPIRRFRPRASFLRSAMAKRSPSVRPSPCRCACALPASTKGACRKPTALPVKVTDETPDTVDLRNVVSRMRAMNRPGYYQLPECVYRKSRWTRAGCFPGG